MGTDENGGEITVSTNCSTSVSCVESDGRCDMSVMQNRDDYFDLVKFLILFCMLWGHVIQYCSVGFDFFANPIFKAIYGFHMPLFALLSGWFFFYSVNKYSLADIFKKKCLSIAFSIVAGNFLYWIVWGVVELIRSGDVTVFVNGGWINKLFGLWFLWAIMISMAIVSVSYKKIKNRFLSFVVMILGAALFFLFPNSVECIFVYPFFLMGFYACKHKDFLKKIAPLRFLSVPIYPLLVGFYGNDYYIYVAGLWGTEYTPLQYLGIDVYRFVTGIVGCIFVLTLMRPIYNLISGRKICTFFADMGSKSLQIYVLQTIAYYVVSVIVGDLLVKTNYCNYVNSHWELYCFVFTFAFAAVLFVALYFAVKLLYKIKIGKYLFGR